MKLLTIGIPTREGLYYKELIHSLHNSIQLIIFLNGSINSGKSTVASILANSISSIDTKIYTFTLSPKLEKVITNGGSRELNSSEVERIKHHYNIGINNPSFGQIIDNTEQTPEETANLILEKIK